MNTIRNRDKHYRNSNNQAKKLKRANFKFAKILLKKVFDIKKNFEEKIGETKNNPKYFWRALKSLGMPSKGGGNLKYH